VVGRANHRADKVARADASIRLAPEPVGATLLVILRAERPDLDDRAYDRLERAILRGLLERPRIYLTDFFYTRCEARARGNLSWRLGLPVPA